MSKWAKGMNDMRAFNGQSIIDLYIAALYKQSSVTKDQIDWYIGNTGYTKITEVTWAADGFQFRMETEISRPRPMCQYVIVTADGEMKFREVGQWFIPDEDGDKVFNTYSAALDYLISLDSRMGEGVNDASLE